MNIQLIRTNLFLLHLIKNLINILKTSQQKTRINIVNILYESFHSNKITFNY
jgi:hypothetical protein